MKYLVLAMLVVAALARCRCDREAPRAPWRFATFNIQDFPKHGDQAANALATIAATGASAIGVQEIVDPILFAREAAARLGRDWKFASIDTSPLDRPSHRLGVLYDAARWELVAVRAHDETRLGNGRWKPTLEVVLADAATGERAHLFVVHFKSGGEEHAIRAQQYAALAALLRAPPPNTVVMGDFNATGADDRDDLAKLARATDLTWASEGLACTAFWDREDGCFRSRLDHVLAWRRPRAIRAAGACEAEGCAATDRCPLAVRDVSDHCPVVVEL